MPNTNRLSRTVCNPNQRQLQLDVSSNFLYWPFKKASKPEELASFVEGILRAQGQKIVKEGNTLETQEETLAELERLANDFSDKLMPILKVLQIL